MRPSVGGTSSDPWLNIGWTARRGQGEPESHANRTEQTEAERTLKRPSRMPLAPCVRRAARRSSAVLALWAVAACATPGARQPARSTFSSNLTESEAYQCATRRLRLDGFVVADAAPADGTAEAFRASPEGTQLGVPEWWRVAFAASRGPEGRTLVETTASAAPTRDGPWGAPPAELLSAVGRLTASCTW